MQASWLNGGSAVQQSGNRQGPSVYADSKEDGIEKSMSKDDDKGHLFREIVRNFITVCALDASVVRKGRDCLLKCCASHNQN